MTQFDFVKSSYSTSGGECVEVARNIPGTAAVRDSKDVTGPVIGVGPTAWDLFRAHVVSQQFSD
ncbi:MULTISPECIES: DUF397 domain-containing protein [unclassified Streptomyces]|uniref:DUF397 domain-containing protein n=1 Tax=unclassified Streptomyces TaxID=2593676 RepID=UPI002E100A0F|nr:DUF397 domain-containing protein [Streptomyces sp. NBC_01197]WSS50498.1 DUF397 domain-containing protein [Streptomyces sp. NBC_01180]